jgi:hypothetical protein
VSDNTDGGVVADAWCVAPWAVGACRVLNVKIPVVIPVITAMAVVSAMRIRTAPPFVGRATAPGSARWGRAPAVAYAPRTESGKASSVLAYRRRVCGRLCEGPGGCPRSVLALSISRQSRWTGVPRPRQVLVWARTQLLSGELSFRRLHPSTRKCGSVLLTGTVAAGRCSANSWEKSPSDKELRSSRLARSSQSTAAKGLICLYTWTSKGR